MMVHLHPFIGTRELFTHLNIHATSTRSNLAGVIYKVSGSLKKRLGRLYLRLSL